MREDEQEAIEYWRKSYPDLTDQELLEIDGTMRRYAELILEVALQDEKKKPPKED